MISAESEVIWVVILVESGVSTLVEAYRNEETARAREEFLRKDVRPDYDEVGIFGVEIVAQSPD